MEVQALKAWDSGTVGMGLTGEVQVSDGELGAFDVDGQVDFATAREVLDVAVPAVFGAAGDRPGALFPDARLGFLVGGAGVHALGLRRLRDDTREGGGRDEFGFALVPFREDLGRRGAAEDAWVDEASESDAGDVSRRAEDAFKVPDCFGTVWTNMQKLRSEAPKPVSGRTYASG